MFEDIAEVVGPIGVLVVVVVWAMISRRHGNGQSDRYNVVVAKLDSLRDDVVEVKEDVRDLRRNIRELRTHFVHHLENHA
jgi:hypothetical protein